MEAPPGTARYATREGKQGQGVTPCGLKQATPRRKDKLKGTPVVRTAHRRPVARLHEF